MMQISRNASSLEKLRALCSAFSTSSLAGAATGDATSQSAKNNHPYRMYDDLAQQTYVYHSSRHSMRDPMYVSISDPVYDVDRPSPKTNTSGSHGLRTDDYSQQTYVYSSSRHSMKEPKYISISEPAYDLGTSPSKTSSPHPYRMVDDYAQQTYVYSANRHSMKDPKYISISEPLYDLGKTSHANAKQPASNTATSRSAARMFDEYAQQTYVYSMSRHSMKDPVYVSISDPVYELGTK